MLDDADPTADVRELLVAPHAMGVLRAAGGRRSRRALAALDRQRLLCAHREGPFGVRHWNTQVERWIAEETGEPIWATWYAGRPLLVTANDYGLGIYNGDVGVVVRPPAGSTARALRAAIDGSAGRTTWRPSRLAQVETMHAMTIHKSQGSQAEEVVVILPPPESRLLTRELFYTAITRAKTRVVVVGSPTTSAPPSSAGPCARRGCASVSPPRTEPPKPRRHRRHLAWRRALPAARGAARRPRFAGPSRDRHR